MLYWYGPSRMNSISRSAAKAALAAATLLQSEQTLRTGIENPSPHKDSSHAGEYLRKRTGRGQAACVVYPGNVNEIMRTWRVEVEYQQIGFPYMSWWESEARGWRRRLGLKDTLKSCRAKLGLAAINEFIAGYGHSSVN